MPPTEQQPDFRAMTLKDLRDGISTLNRRIKRLKDFQHGQARREIAELGAGTAATAAVIVVFPPLAPIVGAATAFYVVAKGEPCRQALIAAGELRKKFKTVYRARPGRAFHDIAARRDRQKARRKQKPRFRFYGPPN